jgi:hypothetical protein
LTPAKNLSTFAHVCDVHTYDERTHGRLRTSVFPQALMYDERTLIWRTGVIRRTTSKYGSNAVYGGKSIVNSTTKYEKAEGL